VIPFVVLVVAFALFRIVGFTVLPVLDAWQPALRAALVPMFLLTASAHWGKNRVDLVRMVPPVFPAPESLVALTGILEIGGALGLLVPATVRLASFGLALLLLAIFPANVYAARHGLTIGGRPVTRLPLRAALQVVFIAAVLAAGW
jgi:uncharacterized membrane protein